MSPDYPVYIISKSRFDNPLTIISLSRLKIRFKVVIEPSEFSDYLQVVPKSNLLVLPENDYGCSIPARNFVFAHSVSLGAKRHWILDDNISAFYRLNNNRKIKLATSTFFKCAEDFTDRYVNVALSGFNYDFFARARDPLPPFYLNTRIYSCILVNNSIPFRWRGKYNEDTDLSLRCLKAGYCTILFNAFLQCKATTGSLSGGNTSTVYSSPDSRLKMAQSLQKQHPDVVKIIYRFNRYQHYVNYRVFRDKNVLQHCPGLFLKNRVDNYGMILKKFTGYPGEYKKHNKAT